MPPPIESQAIDPSAPGSAPPAAVVEGAAQVAEASEDLLVRAQQSMPGKMQEQRTSERVRLRLRAVLVTDIDGTSQKLHGKTVDISGTGVSFVTTHNLSMPRTGTLYIMAGQGDSTHPATIIEAQCRLVVCVLASREGGFRLSLAFTKVAGDGQAILKRLLKDRQPQHA